MKIRTTIKKEETIEKEITLPYFCKFTSPFGDYEYFKITENEIIVDVNPGATYNGISAYSYPTNKSKIAQCEEVTETEFNEAYHKTLFEIGKYVPVPEIDFGNQQE